MVSFIVNHRDVFGVGPICKVLPIEPATYYSRAAILHDPELASERAKSDVFDCEDIKRIFEASGKRYGARKVWHGLRRAGNNIARCTVERLMSAMKIQGVCGAARLSQPILMQASHARMTRLTGSFLRRCQTGSGSLILHMFPVGRVWFASLS
jgi:hypothetical protein